jgi:hypothetical protein
MGNCVNLPNKDISTQMLLFIPCLQLDSKTLYEPRLSSQFAKKNVYTIGILLDMH